MQLIDGIEDDELRRLTVAFYHQMMVAVANADGAFSAGEKAFIDTKVSIARLRTLGFLFPQLDTLNYSYYSYYSAVAGAFARLAVELGADVKQTLVTGLTLLAQVDNDSHYFEKHQIVVAVAKVLGLTT